jgi:hypothetical protein
VARWAGRRVAGSDDGGAIIEFLGMSLLLLVPLLYLVVALARIQAATYGSEFAAREASRGAVVAGVRALEQGASLGHATEVASRRGNAIAALAVEDFGFDFDGTTRVTYACDPQPCLSPGGDIVTTVEVTVGLPGVPGFVSTWLPLGVTVSSTAASSVDGFASGS